LLEANEEDIEKLRELANYNMTKIEDLHQSTGYNGQRKLGFGHIKMMLVKHLCLLITTGLCVRKPMSCGIMDD